jgi:hypothetical protein
VAAAGAAVDLWEGADPLRLDRGMADVTDSVCPVNNSIERSLNTCKGADVAFASLEGAPRPKQGKGAIRDQAADRFYSLCVHIPTRSTWDANQCWAVRQNGSRQRPNDVPAAQRPLKKRASTWHVVGFFGPQCVECAPHDPAH